ncbi:MAG: phage tail protein [Bacteroidota bacterium]
MGLTVFALADPIATRVDQAEAAFGALANAPDGADPSLTLSALDADTLAVIGEQFTAAVERRQRILWFGVDDLPQTGLDRNLELRFDGAKRLGRRVAQQFLGVGEETVSIKGTIYPPQFGSFEMLEEMREEAMLGRPRAVVTRYGRYEGIWCIKAIKDTQTVYFKNGYPRKVEFTLELVHYGQDGYGLGFSF